jgi:hypothetical protein
MTPARAAARAIIKSHTRADQRNCGTLCFMSTGFGSLGANGISRATHTK